MGVYFPAHERVFPSQHPKKFLFDSDANLIWCTFAFCHCCGWLSFLLAPKGEGETWRWLWHLLLEVIVVSWQQITFRKLPLPHVLPFSPSPSSPWLAPFWSSSLVLPWCGTMLLQYSHWQYGILAPDLFTAFSSTFFKQAHNGFQLSLKLFYLNLQIKNLTFESQFQPVMGCRFIMIDQ